ncbi:S8 family peptidase [Nitratireductor sp. ZSWI3]|uniref:S8 family peptidase n=1 Tax=Nitratireductor sp. ZSWI3 TaxID=2966359 RepID=UPI00214FF758|nr:S8 family peptidase [Nitratireductor sp. ZSWI3]MCR4268570.1 S8 family serine peptidase [Nitratireductor sp. ZSWI3]
MAPDRLSLFIILLAGFVILTACDGGEGGSVVAASPETPAPPSKPPAGGYPTFDEQKGAAYRDQPEFTRAAPGAAQEAALRAQFGLPPLCAGTGNPDCASASAYGLQKLDLVHTATLPSGEKPTGRGITIAVVDNGYRLSHQELSGKDITRFLGDAAAIGSDTHGTAVAAIAAGKADGKGMMGVAPDAALHLSSWEDIAEDKLIKHLAAATLDAAAHGAAVQNNSWGFATEKPAGQEKLDFAASGTGDYAAWLATRQGGSADEWRALLAAYDAFQETGVLVFANSNDMTLGDSSAWASLPDFVPGLSDAWIAVSNALFAVDRTDGAILSADLLSAPCGSAARFCLTADGTLNVPTRNGDTAYELGTGTSYAAPQVSGAIAILAQAFPNLAPAEWTARLLATARRDWPGFQSSIAGETTFAAGLRRVYSSLYGHGVPDVKAALSPIGGLAITSGETIASSPATPLSAGLTVTGPLVGNAVAKALKGHRVMVVDALGTDFHVDGSAITSANISSEAAPRLHPGALLQGIETFDRSFAFAAAETTPSGLLRDTATAKLFFSQSFAAMSGSSTFSHLLPLGANDYMQFSGHLAADESMASFAVSRLASRERFAGELSLSAGHASDGLFGQAAEGPFLAAQSSFYSAVNLSLGADLGRGWSLTGFAEMGAGLAEQRPQALVQLGGISYGSLGLSLGKRALLSARDTLSLYAGTLPTALTGIARLRLPVARNDEGVIFYEPITVDLTDADLPLRFGLSYDTVTPHAFDLRFNADLRFLMGVADSSTLALAVSLSKGF